MYYFYSVVVLLSTAAIRFVPLAQTERPHWVRVKSITKLHFYSKSFGGMCRRLLFSNPMLPSNLGSKYFWTLACGWDEKVPGSCLTLVLCTFILEFFFSCRSARKIWIYWKRPFLFDTIARMVDRKNIYSSRYGETNSWGIGCIKTMLVWDGSVMKLIW